MQIYLAIITTALVITQIIRVTQNAVQLRHIKAAYIRDTEKRQQWDEIIHNMEKAITEK
jgi:hypothetical protein